MATYPAKILIVDDDAHVRKSLKDILHYEGYQCIEAQDGKEALDKIKEDYFDLILLDLKLPRISGMEVLKQALALHPELQIVMISGRGSIQKAVEATKIGAYNFIEKPLEAGRVLLAISHALEKRSLKIERDNLLQETRSRYQMIGSDPKILEIFNKIDQTAEVDSSVLLTGKNGTGKGLVAKAIHFNSKRAGFPFVHINCAAIPENLIESEFFGHKKGAFTGALQDREGRFQQAHHGTLFLDEVGEMSLMMQTKLLHVIESKTIDPVGGAKSISLDVRIIFATNRDLRLEVERGNFREDLYYRIDVIHFLLPALRERKKDIQPLAEFFLEMICREQGLPMKVFSQNVWPLLMNFAWPGNVRELRNVVERAAVLGTGKLIDPQLIQEVLHQAADSAPPQPTPSLREARATFEKDYIVQALAASGGKI
ncbi:MAG: sigma-54-dependent transcriptional regulator, partial [bacterium]